MSLLEQNLSFGLPRQRSFQGSRSVAFSDADSEDEEEARSIVDALARKDESNTLTLFTCGRRFQPLDKAKLVFSLLSILVILWLSYRHWHGRQLDARIGDHVPVRQDRLMADPLVHFQGRQECGISFRDIYQSPLAVKPIPSIPKHATFCSNRQTLLDAMSGGGRHGFDAPFVSQGCHFRWYPTIEICMILARFDGVIFIGDDMVKSIYAAFNMLLRENVALGAMEQWAMQSEEREKCKCENQLVKKECAQWLVSDSQAVQEHDHGDKYSDPYYCANTPHTYLSVHTSPASSEAHDHFNASINRSIKNYKPVPVIHSLGISTDLSWLTATESMNEWTSLVDASNRHIPYLWLGPAAAGHLKPPGQILHTGNNALWHYTHEMAKEARSRGMETLGMYNLTLQASSWDGTGYGLDVALVQAMMIINWLARVEST